MAGYYGNYGAPPMGYQGVYDPTQPPPPPQSYGQPTIGFAVDMPPNGPYSTQPQSAYAPYPNPPSQNYGSSYPNMGAPQPTIGFNFDSGPSAPLDNISLGDSVTEIKKQGEEAGYWSVDTSGYRVYNYYSDNSKKGPGEYSNSSNTANFYGPSNLDNNQGRRSPYSQNTSYSNSKGESGLGSGWATASDSSSRDSSQSKSKYRAPDAPTSRVRSDDNEKKYSDNIDLSADKAKTDTEYKSKLDKLAALMTDVSIDESDLADMRKNHDLKQ